MKPKKFDLFVVTVVLLSLVLSACAPATTPAPAPVTEAPAAAPAATEVPAMTQAPAAVFKACQVTDTGGIDDKSFNATAWKGVTDAEKQLGIQGKYLESTQQTDYEKNINAFLDEKCDIIITVGFLLGDATKAAAEKNPNVKFSIVDFAYDPTVPNILGQVFNTDEAAFLAGYLAAAVSKTGKVGTFGGMQIPTVTIFMDGFYQGVQYYNQQKGKSVAVLGWDPTKQTGLFTGNFESTDDGRTMALSLMDEGADIIMPVAGPVGLGTAAAIKERGNAYIIGVDSDWYLTAPDYKAIELTSVMKNMDITTVSAIKSAMDGTFKGGVTVGTLSNGGVGLAPFHDLDSMVPADVKTELDAIKADIVAGKIATKPAAPAATQAPAAPTTAPTAAPSSVSGQVEVFSWWVGPGEADGLAAMVKIFEAQYPNIKFVNAAVAGGAGTNAKAVLATRLAAGDAPDSWQAHAGMETIATFVTANQVQPLDDFFAKTGFGSVLPKTLLPLISQNGHPYSVPVNIHRSNVLWYNPNVLKAAGVTANPKTDFKTWDDFFAACDKVKAAGKTCLALGAPWTAIHLFENVMIGTIGPDKWSGLWTTPPTTDWAGADVQKGIANFGKALSYTNSDASTMSDWQPASKLVADGDAAFNVMGDWAYGYFANPAPNGLALKPHTDFDWAVSPGTYGVFNFLSDSFVLPANAKHPDATMAWLTVAASKEGQEAFNPLKGSICARTDCDPSKFSEYSQDAAKDWSSNTVVGSLMHGVVAAPAWANKIGTAIGLFQASKMDAAAQADFQKALVDACASDGTCK